MAKTKAVVVPNKVLHIRASYLYQAASYLASQHLGPDVQNDQATHKDGSKSTSENVCHTASIRLISDLRNVTSKTLIRMSPEMKQGICKICNTILNEGSTCSSEVENKSKGGKKPWADVLVRKCNVCGTAKRYPLGKRQKRRPLRMQTLEANGLEELGGDAVS
ncbi:hypothetical protein HYALB_00007442 [Hymenoscyphus albidus]|uniref:Uncharacterized protein n=1 Tax=Hymenoscyphus albidus TaxID=595503 RepID=A0A9N9LYA7_9HELO|nr:hypothetical protein HYALB_00007442 [Hymenoscyphus albidus]